MKNGKLQCKDIPDIPILEFLLRLKRREITHTYEMGDRTESFQPPSGCVWEGAAHSVQHAMPAAVFGIDTLVRAKMQMIINRGLVDGCTCGCRGDFELTPKGLALLEVPNAQL